MPPSCRLELLCDYYVRVMDTEPRYDIEVERFGALGISEHHSAIVNVSRADVEGLLKLQLDTMGPLDTAAVRIHRR